MYRLSKSSLSIAFHVRDVSLYMKSFLRRLLVATKSGIDALSFAASLIQTKRASPPGTCPLDSIELSLSSGPCGVSR